MNTTGTGSEGWLILMAVAVLAVVGMLLSGGPTEFMSLLDSTLIRVAREVGSWVRSFT